MTRPAPAPAWVPDIVAGLVVVAVTVLAWHGTATESQAVETYALVLGWVFGRGVTNGGRT